MGPRPCGRGRMRARAVDGRSMGRLQWGHGLAAVEGWATPRSDLAWPYSFNGATALRPWKVMNGPHGRAGPPCASMGPRPCGRGRMRDAEQEEFDAELQWGHGLAAVEGDSAFPPVPTAMWLQWGHGLAAVEGRHGRHEGSPARDASMGPRPCGRGRCPAATGRLPSTGCFNGATALRPWKGPNGHRSGGASPSFNGATALRPWKVRPRA